MTRTERSMRRSTTAARRLAVAMAVGALVVAACGTQLPDEAFAPTQEIVAVDGQEGDTASDAGGTDDTGGSTTTTAAGGDGGGGGGSGGDDAAGGGDEVASGGSGEATGGDDGGGPNQASDVGVTETTIRIGNITAENGVLGDTFAPAVRGLRAWVQATNAAGGIRGRKIELFTCDDREDRTRTLECARRLVEQDKVFALVATNTRALGGASQYLADQDVPVIGFPINNAFYRYPEFFTIYGTSYERNGETVGDDGDLVTLSGQFRWLKQNLDVSKAGVFYYDVAESTQAGKNFARGLEAEGFDVAEYTVSFAAPSFDQAVADMERRGVEIVYDAMDDGANRRLCDAMSSRDFEPVAKVSTVVILGDGVDANYDETCRNKLFVPVESRPYTQTSGEIGAFRDAYTRYQPGLPFHQWALEAWAQGNIARDAIESMGPAPTRDGFIEFLDTMPPNDGGGIMIGTAFGPDQPDVDAPTNKDCFGFARWLDSKGGWHLASEFPFCYPDAKTLRSPASEQGN